MRRVPLIALCVGFWVASSLAAAALTKGGGDTPAASAASAAPAASESGPSLPAGSWAKVCGGASVTRQFEMTATCSAPDAPPTTSTLKLTDCAQPATVGAKDGKLFCEDGPRNPPASGSWAASCINEKVEGTKLTASCLTAGGKVVEASIDMADCASPPGLVAEDGRLSCAEPAAKPVAVVAAATIDDPTEAGKAANAYAGDWDIKTERGDALRLTVKQDGNKVTGSVPFKKQTLTFTGHVDEGGRLQMVWQLGTLTGLGALALLDGGKRLKGAITLADGGAVAGGTWDSQRAAATPAAALPLGETGAKAEGFVDGTITGTVVVRSGPTTRNTRILATLQRGDKVSVKCASNGWCELVEGDRYIARSFVSLGSDQPKAASVAKPVKKVVVAKKKASGSVKEAPPPTPGFLGVPGLIITFGHKNQAQ